VGVGIVISSFPLEEFTGGESCRTLVAISAVARVGKANTELAQRDLRNQFGLTLGWTGDGMGVMVHKWNLRTVRRPMKAVSVLLMLAITNGAAIKGAFSRLSPVGVIPSHGISSEAVNANLLCGSSPSEANWFPGWLASISISASSIFFRPYLWSSMLKGFSCVESRI
jgi:hypothetical protein